MGKRWLIVWLGILAALAFQTAYAYNFEHVNVTTKVNITNAYPEIIDIWVDNGTADSGVILNAGSNYTLYCNITVRDWNGFADINLTNATFWDDNVVNMGDADNPNNHYTNASCSPIGAGYNIYYRNYSCAFDVVYYANNGSNWICNATVQDNAGTNGTNLNYTTINPYYALNVTPVIDYGDIAAGFYSDNQTANVTNFGNMNINVTIRGWGATDGDGLCMVCEHGNVSVTYQKFSLSASDDYAAKTELQDYNQMIAGLTVPKRVTTMEWNTTYWQLYVPVSPVAQGECNGTVMFNAVAATGGT